MRLFLGDDADSNKFTDIRHFDIPWPRDVSGDNVCQRRVAQHVDRSAECISMGFEWTRRGLGFA